ncbi:GntR family transcriptional regulator [Pseudooceanicola sp.]|uniref:GntR family transcriptional regulator n=1 Tax=Pseudooceanicola sp. TaxID=1914328 RepID=UPI00261D54FE|nr:GntR family transcriptional regulator [Pseudooceanicola sp.]MDF1854414.1 GntR family transcriptional regulator [Pseudooceanicola sp.]
MTQDNGYITKTELARRYIQKTILSGQVRAGDRVTTREVSDALGVSETPIREAIRSLSSEGWLTVQNHVGAVVASIRPEQIHEISALRGAICGLAIELSGDYYDAAILAQLDANLEAAHKAVANGEVHAFAELNSKFHHMLCDTPFAPWCLRIVENMLGLMSSQRHGFPPDLARLKQAVGEHQEIVEHIRRGNYAEAAAVARTHELNAGIYLVGAMHDAGIFENQRAG